MSYQHGWRPKPSPHTPPDYDDEVVLAVRSVAEGRANDGQQKLFWQYLMYVTKASDEFQDLSYRPGDPEATNIAEGKRFVGIVIRSLLRPEFDPKRVTPKGVPVEEDAPPPPKRLTTAQRRAKKKEG